jgi:hypothetical protein
MDAYLLLVVDAIEEATGKTFDRRGLDGAGSGVATRRPPKAATSTVI